VDDLLAVTPLFRYSQSGWIAKNFFGTFTRGLSECLNHFMRFVTLPGACDAN
jgi:hypothetical protein